MLLPYLNLKCEFDKNVSIFCLNYSETMHSMQIANPQAESVHGV